MLQRHHQRRVVIKTALFDVVKVGVAQPTVSAQVVLLAGQRVDEGGLVRPAHLGPSGDGQGFDLSGIGRTSHGLAGMRQRVEAAGGRLTVSSTPGEGTLVSAILPTPDSSGDTPRRRASDLTV